MIYTLAMSGDRDVLPHNGSAGLLRQLLKSPHAPTAAFLLFGVLAVVLAVGGEVASHRTWALAAAPGYLLAALVHVAPAGRRWSAYVALAGSTVVPAIAIAISGQRQEEVTVIERSADVLLATGTPYGRDPVDVLDFNPYLPGMSVFGLPHAAGLPGLASDPRPWLAVVFVVAVAATVRGAGERLGGVDSGTAWRLSMVLSCPLIALSICVSGVDLPVAGLALVAVVAAGQGRTGAATLALLAAMTLKWTAWPAAAVTAAALTVSRGARTAVVSTTAVILTAGLLIASVAAVEPRAFLQNAVLFPFGLSSTTSPAASPLPGRLLASHLPGGTWIALTLLGVAAAVVVGSLVMRPPSGSGAAADRLAVGLSAAILLSPASRWGYLVYPFILLTVPRLITDFLPTRDRKSGR